MSYYIFVLGYDLLHDMLNGIECDIAYELCKSVYMKFWDSEYNDFNKSAYECLQEYVNVHSEEIKNELEEMR